MKEGVEVPGGDKLSGEWRFPMVWGGRKELGSGV